jgi:beta-mannosidase
VVLALATARHAAAQETVSLSGNDWFIHEEPAGVTQETFTVGPVAAPAWIPAVVPGNIQADLEAAHLLKPLWYGAGEPRLFDVARKDWWYRKDFLVPESFKGKRLALVFDGVDHEWEVWLNGHWVGRSAGMFRRFRFDVGEFTRPGEVNRLAVRIARMPEKLVPLLLNTDGPGVNASPTFVSGVVQTMQTLKDLKSPTNWGWDWGVNIWTLGIWKDARLESSGPARIDWTRVQTGLSDDHAKATVTATLEVDSAAELPMQAEVRVWGNGQQATARVEAALKKGRNLVRAELTLDRPALWWPNGQGEQPLYVLHAELVPSGGGPASDARDTRFGIRDVRWMHTEGAAADFISRYQLIVNGRPVRTIGSNLIPPDLLFGRMGPRALNLIRRAKAAGMNTLRLWGGGVILQEAAYDLADKLGIMLVLELPLANYWPDADAAFMANLEATARNIVKQLRNHPAIIEFDGGNEMPWNSLTKHPALQLLQKVVAEEDGRLFRATCPDLGATHGPWYFNLQRDCLHFDNLKTMRAGEFGAASPANLEVWHRDIPPRSQWPIHGVDEPIQIRKNIVQAVFAPDYWLRKTYLDDMFGSPKNLPELIEAGQWIGAEGLRYAVDALRRHGKRLGGLTTWDFNEPWSNGAGSYLVDYDGRALMNYDFFKQAVAPIALSLKHDSIFYDSRSGVRAELFLVSDAPRPAANLLWKWLARDRRGRVFADGKGTASIQPIEVKSLGAIELRPPAKTAFGPLLLEMRLEDATGTLLTERVHVFGLAGAIGSLGGLLDNRQEDCDDDASQIAAGIELPNGSDNLAYVGNGAKPATASSARPEPIHQPQGINDGAYGNDRSWIGTAPRSWFQIDLGKKATLGRFKLGRDRTGQFSDRGVDYLKIETSLDGQTWKTVFEQARITGLPGFNATKTMTVHVVPVEAQFVRATVYPMNPAGGEFACLDEFEVYAPAKGPPAALPRVDFRDGRPEIRRPVRRTTLQVEALPPRVEGGQEVLELRVRNTGPMTALFCEPHPLIEYRTDLFIENNHCFIPPGESRTLTIKAAKHAPGGLTLAQTGWRVSCWNAGEVVIEPSAEVVLAVGRRDAMCREFAGYFDSHKIEAVARATLQGRRPDPARLPYRLDGGKSARFEFSLSDAQAKRPARLRIHTADHTEKTPTKITVTVNGGRMEESLPAGLGIQRSDPAHLAFPATLEFFIPAADLRPGKNVLKVRVEGNGWFSWDALDLTTGAPASGAGTL